MTDQSVNAPIAAVNGIKEMVWYSGIDALLEGEAVCYNTDYGTAATRTPSRANRVERPSTSNNMAFAGVAAQSYAARSTGQFIEIYVPGSRGVNIALGANTVIDTGMLTFQVGGGLSAGRFVLSGFPGRGTAIPRQTQAAAVITSDLIGTTWSLAADGITLTHASATVLAGDKVVLLAGVAEDAAIYIVGGTYTVASVTSATICVLSATAHAATAAGAMDCIGYIYRTNPMCQADLLTGEESGGIEFVNIIDGGNAAQPHMAGGITYVPGGITIAADIDIALADGTRIGERKGVWLLGALTTKDVTVVPATAGLTMAGGALTEILGMDVAGDAVFLKWDGIWCTTSVVGGATEA
jgi:hypothetical protein